MDPEVEDKLKVSLFLVQGELSQNFLEDPGVEDVVDFQRDTETSVLLVDERIFFHEEFLDELEDTDYASSRDTALVSFQTVQITVELKTSYSDFEELLLEVILREGEEVLDKSSLQQENQQVINLIYVTDVKLLFNVRCGHLHCLPVRIKLRLKSPIYSLCNSESIFWS